MSDHGQEHNTSGTIEDVQAALEIALRGHLVVQAWLGYAQVLFCGFGTGPIHIPADVCHFQPAFELQTNYADWTVTKDGAKVGSADDEDSVAGAAIDLLVGNHVTGWTFDAADQLLTIDVAGGLRLLVAPMKDEDVRKKEAWSIRMDDGMYWVLSCDGTIRQHRDDSCVSGSEC